jgi:hypothetical protein
MKESIDTNPLRKFHVVRSGRSGVCRNPFPPCARPVKTSLLTALAWATTPVWATTLAWATTPAWATTRPGLGDRAHWLGRPRALAWATARPSFFYRSNQRGKHGPCPAGLRASALNSPLTVGQSPWWTRPPSRRLVPSAARSADFSTALRRHSFKRGQAALRRYSSKREWAAMRRHSSNRERANMRRHSPKRERTALRRHSS